MSYVVHDSETLNGKHYSVFEAAGMATTVDHKRNERLLPKKHFYSMNSHNITDKVSIGKLAACGSQLIPANSSRSGLCLALPTNRWLC